MNNLSYKNITDIPGNLTPDHFGDRTVLIYDTAKQILE